ncbi:hypothetical protein HPB48_017815 [Haemaphysalis longicornis]|uniref:Uncharacterized protein n=1 Tax=Haemaphysalis longicornis TaxID=44386 RepID=A0A9J6FLG0_HAELO|nr:hypothetical protein HPB48_017815 [Haemaphysalis longicornis]
MYRGAAYADGLQYQRCIDLWQYALELRVARDTLLHTEAGQAAAALVRLYLDMLERAALLRDRLRLEDVLADGTPARRPVRRRRPAAGRAARFYRRHLDNFDKLLRVLTHLRTCCTHCPSAHRPMRRLCGGSWRRRLAQRPRNSVGDSLLHLVEAHAHVFPDAALATLLLECGADPEAVNEARSTPLHVAALRNNFRPAVVQALLSHGAHLDRRNANGNQPHRMLAGIADLQCLAARKIVERRIPFVGEVPSTLEDFIRIH